LFPENSKHWFEVFAEPHASGILVRTIDINEQKNLEFQYQHLQKIEAVGGLAVGFAHDFNNKLGVMMLYCEMALSSIGTENPEAVRYLENILSGVNQASALTRQLLAFGRKEAFDLRPVVLNHLIEPVTDGLATLIGANIEMNFQLAPGLWLTSADSSQVDQIILNLIINARDSILQKGVITINTANISFDEEDCRHHAEVTPGEYVMLSVSDTGKGMSQAVLARLFEPFFSTKDLGRGTGLGLASVRRIVRQSRGYIEVQSEEGIGTTISIYFPRTVANGKDDVRTERRIHGENINR
jgi:two-component system, cell cycle sensor histidine kinase and response regulator CckA